MPRSPPPGRPSCRDFFLRRHLRSAACRKDGEFPVAEADFLMLGSWIAASLRSATPLLLVMLGETLTQRTGIINLGVEGEMLMGACVGFAAAATSGSAGLGLAVGACAGLALSAVHAALVLGARANQIGSGLAVWMLGL